MIIFLLSLSSLMRLIYQSKELLYIPSIIHFYKIENGYINFSLNKKLNKEDKDILYNNDNITELKLEMNLKSSEYKIINNYVYKYHIIKDKNNEYHLYKNKISSISGFSKMLNSIWFINNL